MIHIKKILCLLLFVGIFFMQWLDANAAWAFTIPDTVKWAIEPQSIDADTDKNLWKSLVSIGTSVLANVKYILSAVAVLFLVYAWAMMVFSLGSDEERLSSAKRQVWYAALGLMFINIPWTLFAAFFQTGREINEPMMNESDFQNAAGDNIFFNVSNFEITYTALVWWIEILIFWLALFVIIFAWFRIMTARWDQEKVTESRNRLIYWIAALFLVGFVEVIKQVAFEWDISTWGDVFGSVANLVLLFAGPTAIFFLFLAAFYYMTSNGDEERAKKWKSIVINTLIAVFILLASYTFLKDLLTL